MKEFATFVTVVFILMLVALFVMGSEDFGDFNETSASLQEQVKSIHK